MFGRRKRFVEQNATVAGIIGKRRLNEFTGVSGIPSFEGVINSAPGLVQPFYANRRNGTEIDRDKKKPKPSRVVPKMRQNVVAGILGRRKVSEAETESEIFDKSVIPNDAKPFTTGQFGIDKIQKPTKDTIVAPQEELIQPSAALVAPDTTPDSLVPLDPSQVPPAKSAIAPVPPNAATPPDIGPVPEPPGVLDTILGREPGFDRMESKNGKPTWSKMSMMDFVPDADKAILQESKTAQKSGEEETAGMKNLCNIAREYF